jgi:hypothetical protein
VRFHFLGRGDVPEPTRETEHNHLTSRVFAFRTSPFDKP